MALIITGEKPQGRNERPRTGGAAQVHVCRVDGSDLLITVDVSLNETWNGTELKRHCRIEGDKLFVETAPAPSALFPGKTSVARLEFEREK